MNTNKKILETIKGKTPELQVNTTMKNDECSYVTDSTYPLRQQSWLIILALFTCSLIAGSFLLPDSAAAEPLVTAISPSTPLVEATPGIIIDGSGFSSTPTVYLTKYNDWDNPGKKIAQVLTGTPGDSQIEFTVTTCGLNSYIPPSPWSAYLWVVDDTGVHNVTGFTVQLGFVRDNTPPAAANFQDGNSSPEIFPPGGHLNSGLDDAYPILPSIISIQSKFYESSLQSPVGCYYSIDDGATWTFMGNSTPMSTGAVYCIDNNVTVPGGSVAIKMRACSPCGGCGETITKNRVIDTTGPEPGVSFTVTPGVSECTLAWSPTTDSGIGMHDTEPYSVYMQTDSFTVDPPGTCSGWSIYSGSDTGMVKSSLKDGHSYYYKLCYKDAYNNISSYGANPVECVLPGIILAPGVTFSEFLVKGPALDLPVDAFRLSTNMALATVSELVVSNYIRPINTSNISEVKLFRDDGSIPDEFDAGDTLIASTVFSDVTAEATFSGLTIPVSGTPEQYIITYSVVDTPTHGATLRGTVTSLVGDVPWSGGDNGGGGLNIDALPPTTTISSPVPWQQNETTITFSYTDGPVDTATGIYGCFGNGCTPSVLGGNSMTSACGDGNVCVYDVRYYSVDIPGNVEAIKTSSNWVQIDRKPPSGGTFSATVVFGPKIVLEWGGFSDVGVGLRTDFPYRYKILRSTDAMPPPEDCSSNSGNTTRTNNTSYELSPSPGLIYSFRLCAYDKLGNVNSDHTATATWGTLPPPPPIIPPELCPSTVTCETCHGPNPNMGGSRYEPPRGHAFHGPECNMCHREGGDTSHVDGIITINFESGYQGGDSTWPGGGGGMSCGGTWSPVGGDPGGGMMGCHTMPTPNYPGITPEWECMWDDFPMCNPPPGP